MSGISGIYNRDGRPVGLQDLRPMGEAIAHRGPDRADDWSEGQAGLGHRMLWSTPESLSERLPLVSEGGDLVITADARIDNRGELIGLLGLNGRPGKEMSDSELILQAYERWGEDCPQRLLGDFAFAIWDGRLQQMFCARDHFGVKPFYYCCSSRTFAFGSEIKALLALPEVPRRLNETRMADFLLMIGEDKASTFYEGILRLPPAHRLTVTAREVRLRAYWSLDPTRELKLGSDEEYAEAYRDVFTEAVRCRLRSAHKVGALLSGGLDTSSIVCVSRKLLEGHGNQPLPTFSAVFDGVPEADERSYIDAVVDEGGIAPNFISANNLNPLADINEILRQQDEMFYGPNIHLAWTLHRAARDSGVRVLLNGLHGDYAVSHGISYLSELFRGRRWMSAISEAKGLSKRLYAGGVRAREILWHRAVKPQLPKALSRRQGPLPSTFALLNPDLARRTRTEERFRTLSAERNGQARTAREEQLLDLTSGVVPYNLELADRVSAAFSVESRYPFCDRRLVEFCMALPGSQRLQHGWTRMVVRRAMAGTLPEKVRWREGKADINPHFARSLIAHERATLERTILAEQNGLEEFVNEDALRQVYDRYRANKTGYGDAVIVWSATVMAMWLARSQLTRTPQIVGGVTP